MVILREKTTTIKLLWYCITIPKAVIPPSTLKRSEALWHISNFSKNLAMSERYAVIEILLT